MECQKQDISILLEATVKFVSPIIKPWYTIAHAWVMADHTFLNVLLARVKGQNMLWYISHFQWKIVSLFFCILKHCIDTFMAIIATQPKLAEKHQAWKFFYWDLNPYSKGLRGQVSQIKMLCLILDVRRGWNT